MKNWLLRLLWLITFVAGVTAVCAVSQPDSVITTDAMQNKGSNEQKPEFQTTPSVPISQTAATATQALASDEVDKWLQSFFSHPYPTEADKAKENLLLYSYAVWYITERYDRANEAWRNYLTTVTPEGEEADLMNKGASFGKHDHDCKTVYGSALPLIYDRQISASQSDNVIGAPNITTDAMQNKGSNEQKSEFQTIPVAASQTTAPATQAPTPEELEKWRQLFIAHPDTTLTDQSNMPDYAYATTYFYFYEPQPQAKINQAFNSMLSCGVPKDAYIKGSIDGKLHNSYQAAIYNRPPVSEKEWSQSFIAHPEITKADIAKENLRLYSYTLFYFANSEKAIGNWQSYAKTQATKEEQKVMADGSNRGYDDHRCSFTYGRSFPLIYDRKIPASQE